MSPGRLRFSRGAPSLPNLGTPADMSEHGACPEMGSSCPRGIPVRSVFECMGKDRASKLQVPESRSNSIRLSLLFLAV